MGPMVEALLVLDQERSSSASRDWEERREVEAWLAVRLSRDTDADADAGGRDGGDWRRCRCSSARGTIGPIGSRQFKTGASLLCGDLARERQDASKWIDMDDEDGFVRIGA